MKRGLYTAFKNVSGKTSVLAPTPPRKFKKTIQKKFVNHLDAATHLHRAQRGSRPSPTDTVTMEHPPNNSLPNAKKISDQGERPTKRSNNNIPTLWSITGKSSSVYQQSAAEAWRKQRAAKTNKTPK